MTIKPDAIYLMATTDFDGIIASGEMKFYSPVSGAELIDLMQKSAAGDEVAEITALINSDITEVPDKCMQMALAFARGVGKCSAEHALSDDWVEKLSSVAARLYSEERFEEVLPLALHLSLNRPLDAFTFFVGRCLQELGDPLLAGTIFRIVMNVHPEDMQARWRYGECQVMIGQRKDSKEIFDIALDQGQGLEAADEYFARWQQAIIKYQHFRD